METNVALLISNIYFDLLVNFRDLRWRSDHQVIPCRAWVVTNVVDEHIRLCAIAVATLVAEVDVVGSTLVDMDVATGPRQF